MSKPLGQKWAGVPVESRMLRTGEFIEFQRITGETGWVSYRVIDFRGSNHYAGWNLDERRFAESNTSVPPVVVNLILSLEFGRNEPDA
jgi:hypothetical protein